MSFNIKQRRINQVGFTFIELVIAITILGIIGGIAVRSFLTYLSDAKIGATQASLRVIKQEVKHYFDKVHKYPDTLRDLVRKPADITVREWGGPYFGDEDEGTPEVPQDGWGNDFVYKALPGNHPPFTLYSWGKNGPDSPEDERIYS